MLAGKNSLKSTLIFCCNPHVKKECPALQPCAVCNRLFVAKLRDCHI